MIKDYPTISIKLCPETFLAILLILFMHSSLIGAGNFSGASIDLQTSDPRLKIETVAQGFNHPTSMAFLGPDDILVSEKNNGKVLRIVNNTLLPYPVIDLKVANAWERGLLGIAVFDATNNHGEYDSRFSNIHSNRIQENSSESLTTFVFLYFTKSDSAETDGGDFCPRPNFCQDKGVANYLYRYEFKDGRLVNPKLLLKIPAAPGADHNGGAIAIGPDNNIYVVVGDGDSCFAGTCYRDFNTSPLNSTRSNYVSGAGPDGRGGVLRVTQDGNTVPIENGTATGQKGMPKQEEGILGGTHPLNKYYAYGIRNGFGLDFDPLNGKLWNTENGAGFGDEINLVEPGFNSGWAKMQGIWPVPNNDPESLKDLSYSGGNIANATINRTLVNFGGKGKYSAPELTWNLPVAPTALKFYNSDKLGEHYKNDMFMAGFVSGDVYHFDLNENRTALQVAGVLKDKVANNPEELKAAVFGRGFGGITDIEVGPDGFLYLVSFTNGKLYRIITID